jgi:uncharacterized membrane protein YkvA (DUF1232 family)
VHPSIKGIAKMSESPKGFENARKKADEIIDDVERLNRLLQQAINKAQNQKTKIMKIWEDLLLLIELVRAYARGEYHGIPWKTIIYAVAAIIYFVNPLDIIPDFILGIGYLDDATVIAFVINAIHKELERFREFRSEQTFS